MAGAAAATLRRSAGGAAGTHRSACAARPGHRTAQLAALRPGRRWLGRRPAGGAAGPSPWLEWPGQWADPLPTAQFRAAFRGCRCSRSSRPFPAPRAVFLCHTGGRALTAA